MNKKIDLRFWFFVGALILCISLLSRTDIKNVPAWAIKKPTVSNIKKSQAESLVLELLEAKGVSAEITINHDSTRNIYKIPKIEVTTSSYGLWHHLCLYSPDTLKSESLFVLEPGVRITISYSKRTYTLPFSSKTNENELSRVVPIVWYDEELNCLRDCKGNKINEDTEITITVEEIDKGILYKHKDWFI